MNIAQNQQVPLPEWFNKAQAKRAAKCAPPRDSAQLCARHQHRLEQHR